jgi:hypothetical protein
MCCLLPYKNEQVNVFGRCAGIRASFWCRQGRKGELGLTENDEFCRQQWWRGVAWIAQPGGEGRGETGEVKEEIGVGFIGV